MAQSPLEGLRINLDALKSAKTEQNAWEIACSRLYYEISRANDVFGEKSEKIALEVESENIHGHLLRGTYLYPGDNATTTKEIGFILTRDSIYKLPSMRTGIIAHLPRDPRQRLEMIEKAYGVRPQVIEESDVPAFQRALQFSIYSAFGHTPNFAMPSITNIFSSQTTLE